MEAKYEDGRCSGIHSSFATRYVRVMCIPTGVMFSNALTEPDPDDAVEAKISDQYKQDKTGYEKEARDWTKRYAMGKK